MGLVEDTAEPRVYERDGWRWIYRCPVCRLEAERKDDDWWSCAAGHIFDMPNDEVLSRP